MSLINRMLQELDARGAEADNADRLGTQVRAVPRRAAYRAGWWVALTLALLLSAAVLWIWLRPAAPAANPGPAIPPELALKLAPNLAALPRQMAQAAPMAEPELATPDSRMPPSEARAAAPDSAIPVPQHEERAKEQPAPAMPASTPGHLAVTVSLPAPEAKNETARSVEPANAQLASAKLVKELTPQQRAENEYRKALALIPQGRAADAIAGLEQALALDAHHAAARQTLAGLLLENRRAEDAARRLQEGLALDPGQTGMAMILARLELDKGELQAAVETLQRSLPQSAERADYRAFLAALLQRQGRHKEAVEQYLFALRKMPQNGIWWMGAGISLQAENRLAEAQDAFGKAKASNVLSADLQAFIEQKLAQLQLQRKVGSME